VQRPVIAHCYDRSRWTCTYRAVRLLMIVLASVMLYLFKRDKWL
jgi:hypothetical protein